MNNTGSKTFTNFLLCRFKNVIVGGILLFPTWAFSVDFEGQIIRVADGDTLTILRDQEKIKIRLAEIDAPEKAQHFGQQSKQSLSDLCLGKPARIEDQGRDRYGRTIGRVWCAGIDANAQQVQQGMAWVYDRYVTDRSLYALQNAARSDKRGLWSDPLQVQPWKWRKEKKLSHHAVISSKLVYRGIRKTHFTKLERANTYFRPGHLTPDIARTNPDLVRLELCPKPAQSEQCKKSDGRVLLAFIYIDNRSLYNCVPG